MNDTQFLLYAAKHYDNVYCNTLEDFYSDLKPFTTLKKLFTKYYTKKVIKERLILNYLISLFNVFDTSFVITVILYRIPEEHYSAFKSFLLYMQRCPDAIRTLDGKFLDIKKIEEDKYIIEKLDLLEKNNVNS